MNFLLNYVSHKDEVDTAKKIQRFNYINATVVYRNLNKKVTQDTLVKFYKTMPTPRLLYSSEIWTLTRTNEISIQTAEMKMLRKLAGYTRWNEECRKVNNYGTSYQIK